MTTKTRRALNRVRNHARSLVRAVEAPKPQDQDALTPYIRRALWGAGWMAGVVEHKLSARLEDDGPARKAPLRITGSDGPGAYYRRDDEADEARDVAAELAAREEAS